MDFMALKYRRLLGLYALHVERVTSGDDLLGGQFANELLSVADVVQIAKAKAAMQKVTPSVEELL